MEGWSGVGTREGTKRHQSAPKRTKAHRVLKFRVLKDKLRKGNLGTVWRPFLPSAAERHGRTVEFIAMDRTGENVARVKVLKSVAIGPHSSGDARARQETPGDAIFVS